MPETSIQVPTEFSQLSKAEQVRYIQALWDQISERPEEIPVPDASPAVARVSPERVHGLFVLSC